MLNKQALNIIACVCHEANKAICESVGDTSQVHWNEAPEWQRGSAIEGVVEVLDDPSITPETLHKRWMKKKIDDGWVYGSEKSEEKKTHPNLVDYDDLSDIDKLKDDVFLAICNSMRYTR